MSDKNCIFCDIASGKTDTVLELETEDYVIFKDIRPAARHHYLIVPKQHFESLMDLDKSHSNLGLFPYLYHNWMPFDKQLFHFSVLNAGGG